MEACGSFRNPDSFTKAFCSETNPDNPDHGKARDQLSNKEARK